MAYSAICSDAPDHEEAKDDVFAFLGLPYRDSTYADTQVYVEAIKGQLGDALTLLHQNFTSALPNPSLLNMAKAVTNMPEISAENLAFLIEGVVDTHLQIGQNQREAAAAQNVLNAMKHVSPLDYPPPYNSPATPARLDDLLTDSAKFDSGAAFKTCVNEMARAYGLSGHGGDKGERTAGR